MTEAKKVAREPLDDRAFAEWWQDANVEDTTTNDRAFAYAAWMAACREYRSYAAERVAEARLQEHETSCWQCYEELEGHCDRHVELSAALAVVRKG